MKPASLLIALGLSTTFQAAFAQITSSRPPYILAVGNASMSVKPDQVRIDVGVVTQATAAQEASTQNATQVANVIAQLRQVLGAAADIKTISYTLSPNYTYPPGGGTGTLLGYTATNIVEVTSDDLSLIGKVIDAATQAGANRVQSLQFTLKDEDSVRAQVLGLAATRAKSQATAIATGLGVKLGAVLSASEGGSGTIQPIGLSAAAAGSAATPVEPGLVSVQATVTLELAITQ
ncbi:MAG: SIMPL domain-containing protein [Acidobacteriota bacterium]|nr:SIMPL domain-containing protein [Acidobacteriota bacterium]